MESGAVPTEPESSNHADVIGGKLQHSRRRGGNKLVETLVAMAGNVLEWYDFAVFGAFSDIIGKVFFRPKAGHKATAESFLVFWAAFMARPFGGMLLGYIGDTRGRKKALEISMFLDKIEQGNMVVERLMEDVVQWNSTLMDGIHRVTESVQE